MAAAKITTPIVGQDNFQLIETQIGAILVVESLGQEAIEVAAGRDPEQVRLKVYVGRVNPWPDFIDAPDYATPIININFDRSTVDKSASNVVRRQQCDGLFNIDCYGYGQASDEAEGHQPGDLEAHDNCLRAVTLVRRILMAGVYTYLDMQGVVGSRMPDSITVETPQIDGRYVQQVRAARIVLQVKYIELSPQVQGEPLELVAAEVMRAEDGQLLLRAHYPQELPP